MILAGKKSRDCRVVVSVGGRVMAPGRKFLLWQARASRTPSFAHHVQQDVGVFREPVPDQPRAKTFSIWR